MSGKALWDGQLQLVNDGDEDDPIYHLLDEDDVLIVEVHEWGLDAEQHKRRAEFIVRACNSHDDMLEALEWAEGALAPFSKEPAEKSGINMIRAAIAKARGQDQ